MDQHVTTGAFVPTTDRFTVDVLNTSEIEKVMTKWIKDVRITDPITERNNEDRNMDRGLLISVHLRKIIEIIEEKTTTRNIIASFKRGGVVIRMIDNRMRIYISINDAQVFMNEYHIRLNREQCIKLTPPQDQIQTTTALQITDRDVQLLIEQFKAPSSNFNNSRLELIDTERRDFVDIVHQHQPFGTVTSSLAPGQLDIEYTTVIQNQENTNHEISPEVGQRLETRTLRRPTKTDRQILAMPMFDSNGIRRPFTNEEYAEYEEQQIVDFEP
ncbi:hypothetical protein EIN_023090 [Entamoeba invadens IP1]|uniref:hypothetical protein n=1 Tax=Entamoeba invadens IP1 TaxID=370355 RepID=UPI0002C3E5F3|nr:hypothetical protein EIN_023090 [Entamoeba invadens IP1]ELP90650.1 hypothetical protein EIN_023090 [Entamoeba invadens IP1]|eukprot:XP_004257421.1 hypothetical protein EIN_023090 [Entamoeba invadens IP1]